MCQRRHRPHLQPASAVHPVALVTPCPGVGWLVGVTAPDSAFDVVLCDTAFCHPTLWKDTFERMVADGARSFVEAGPGEMLTKMVRWIDRTTRCVSAGSLAAIRAAVDIVGRS